MSTTTVDLHKPSTFDPAAYSYIGEFYQGPRAFMPPMSDHELALRRRISANPYSGNHKSNGTCDHCGAFFFYGEIFEHTGGDLIVVGHICANDAFGSDSRRDYDRRRMQRTVAGAKKRGKVALMAQQFTIDTPGLETALQCGHHISEDLRHKLLQYGSLSPKQVALAMKLPADMKAQEEREAQEALERAKAPDWTPGRQVVTGEILTTKWQDSDYGGSLKMLVKLEDGRKCWGSVPASVDSYTTFDGRSTMRCGREHYIGAVVEFTANFAPKDDDLKFAFYKRPTKATITTECPGVVEQNKSDAEAEAKWQAAHGDKS